VADLRIRAAPLKGIDVPPGLVADMIDEIPILLVAAACASGSTRVTGAAELRVKESDRLAAMAAALSSLGVQIRETPDGAIVEGGAIRGGQVDSLGDHRIAMSMAVASQLSTGSVRVRDCANVDTSFPGFIGLAQSCGFGLALA
jgi:3-phosphoshikimate 1-carboxyvinyltransferase